ncbi:MAG: hypothetical protein AB1Z22_05565, partial [Synechococcaceae cyanobacterium]
MSPAAAKSKPAIEILKVATAAGEEMTLAPESRSASGAATVAKAAKSSAAKGSAAKTTPSKSKAAKTSAAKTPGAGSRTAAKARASTKAPAAAAKGGKAAAGAHLEQAADQLLAASEAPPAEAPQSAKDSGDA